MKSLQLLLLGVLLAAARTAVTAQETNKPAPVPPTVPTPAAAAEKADVVVKGTARKTATPDRNIRFQFDGIPYADVVDRVSQMAGKPLLSDTNVVGTLTYDDPNAYSYTEALDTLNLILAMRGVMLLEDGNNLRLVPF